jgi:hypothetical protein
LAFNTKKHDKVLQRTLDEIQSGVFDTVKSLENEIAELVAQGLPVEVVRPQIMAAFTRYSDSVRSVAKPLVNISADYMEQSRFAVDAQDLVAQNTILSQSEATLETTMSGMNEEVVSTVVLGTVAGLGTAALANQVRGRISGIQMESTDPDVRREQRKLRKMMKQGATAAELAVVTAAIKRKLPGNVNTSASLATRMSTASESVVGSFDGTFAKARATRLGIERFRYEGGIIETSRPFCRGMLGREMTRDDIQSLWGSDSWAGKEPGDPFVVRGGYNCLHYWVPIENEED